MPIDNPLIPLSRELAGFGKVVLKGAGLAFIKPKFFSVDANKIARENDAEERAASVGRSETAGNDGYDFRGSLFGLPVWDSVSLVAGPYTKDDGTVITSSNQITLPIALIEITNPRNVIVTPIAGRNGTVKEYMSDNDYHVNIKGSLCSDYSNIPPADLLNAFYIITTHPESLTVYSNFMDYFGIYRLTVMEPIIRQREGTRNVVDFELRCLSDIPILLDA